MEMLVDSVVIPVVSAVLGTFFSVALPILIIKGVRYLNRAWKLDIDMREQAKLQDLAADIAYKTEALVGGGRGKEKMDLALPELVEKAAAVGIDIAEDVARAKLEKVLRWEDIKPES